MRFSLAAKIVCAVLLAAASSRSSTSAQEQSAAASTPQHNAGQHVSVDGEPLPEGVIAELGTRHFRSGREVIALNYLQDGKTIALTTLDGYVQHWDAASGQLLREKRFTDREGLVDTAPASGRQVAVRGTYIDREQQQRVAWIGVVSAFSATLTMEMRVADRLLRQVAVSPDGSLMAYGGDQVHMVDVASQAELAARPAPMPLSSLAISLDGKTLAIGTSGQVQLWRWDGTTEPLSVEIPLPQFLPSVVAGVAFSPDGKNVAIGFDAEVQGILLFDTSTGEQLRSFGVPGVNRWDVRMLQFSPDGKLLAAPISARNDHGGVALWEVSTGKFVRRLAGQLNVDALAFSPDSQNLAACGYYGVICVWNVETGELAGSKPPGHMQPPYTVRFVPNDQQLVSAGDDGTIHIWNLSDSGQARVIEPVPDKPDQNRSIRGMDISPDGKLIVTSSLDNTDRIFNLANGWENLRVPGHGTAGVHRWIRFTSDGKQFASLGDDAQVHMWDVATGKIIRSFSAQPADELDVARLKGLRLLSGVVSPDASRAVGFLGNGYVYDTLTGNKVVKIERQWSSGDSVAISPNNQYVLYLAIGRMQPVQLVDGVTSRRATSHAVELRNLGDGKILAKVELDGGGIGPSAFSPDGHTVAVTSVDNQYRCELRKVPDLSRINVIDLPSRPSAVEFSHSGKLLATALANGTILVWDLDHLPERAKP